MPGIGSGGGNSKVKNVKASPDTGYQGYIKDGTSLTDYTFMDGTPFQDRRISRSEGFIQRSISDRSGMPMTLTRPAKNRSEPTT